MNPTLGVTTDATEPRVIRSISAADFARISDEFAKTLHPNDAMICEIHALRAERDALLKDARLVCEWRYTAFSEPTP
jgi:hypothetical protein